MGATRKRKKRRKKRNPPAQLPPREQRERLQPVSLYPLTFAQALKALVAVKPKGRA